MKRVTWVEERDQYARVDNDQRHSSRSLSRYPGS
jgi:hypothetical protein